MLVQYVVLRADLWKDMDWPLGSIVAQACHAATAALWDSRKEPSSQQYCSPAQLDHMHKVVKHSSGQKRHLPCKVLCCAEHVAVLVAAWTLENHVHQDDCSAALGMAVWMLRTGSTLAVLQLAFSDAAARHLCMSVIII